MVPTRRGSRRAVGYMWLSPSRMRRRAADGAPRDARAGVEGRNAREEGCWGGRSETFGSLKAWEWRLRAGGARVARRHLQQRGCRATAARARGGGAQRSAARRGGAAARCAPPPAVGRAAGAGSAPRRGHGIEKASGVAFPGRAGLWPGRRPGLARWWRCLDDGSPAHGGFQRCRVHRPRAGAMEPGRPGWRRHCQQHAPGRARGAGPCLCGSCV
jgi:hypothetical protein